MSRFNKLHCVLFAVFSLLTSSSFPCLGTQQTRVVKVGVLTDNYPFSYRDSTGFLRGFAYELVLELEHVMGVHFERVEGVAEVINGAFERGELDMLQSYAWSPKREESFSFSFPYITMQGRIFVRKSLTGIRSLADLKGKHVLVHPNSVGEEILRNAGLHRSIVYVESVEQAFQKLNNGEGDATLAGLLTGLSLLHYYNLENFDVVENDIEGYEVKYCIALQKGNEQLLARVNEGLAILVRTGKFDTIYRKWFGFISPSGFTLTQVLIAVALGLTIALIIAILAALRQQKLRTIIAQQADTLRESERKFRDIVTNLDEGFYSATLDGILLEHNYAFNRILGFAPDENLRGIRLHDFWSNPSDREQYIATLLSSGFILNYPIHAKTKNGKPIVVLASAHIVYDRDHQPLRIEGVFLDITKRMETEQELQQRVTELTTIHRVAERLTKLQTPETLAHEILKILEETVEYDYGAVILIEEETNKLIPFALRNRKNPEQRSLLDPEYLERFHLYVDRGVTGWVASHGKSVRLGNVCSDDRYIRVYDDVCSELCVPLKVGDRIIGLINLESTRANAFSESDQRVLETIAAQIAIAIQSAQLYEDLRTSEERYRRISELISDYAYAFRVEEGNKLVREWVTDSFVRITGYTSKEMDERGGWASIIHPDDMDIARKRAQRLFSGQDDVSEFRILRKDGTVRWLRDHGIPIWDPQKQRVIRIYGAAEDITDHKDAEERLKQAHERYEHFFMHDLSADFICTPEGALIACNPSFVNMFGFASLETALSTNIADLFTSPDEFNDIITLLSNGQQCTNREIRMKRCDGSLLYIMANFVGRSTSEKRLSECSGYLVDMTKQRLLEEELLQRMKLESLGTLASGIAHDFNNILGIILAHASLLQRFPPDQAVLRKHIDAITQSCTRGADLVKQMLTFARKTEAHVEPIQINDVVNEIVRLIHETFPKTIETHVQLDPSLPLIEGDTTQLHQVLLNLCVNARDAMPKGGTLTITTFHRAGNTLQGIHPKATEQDYVVVQVTDTGCGMDEETKRRIFEPFFTTKEKGKGTGLGLSLVYGIMENHRGFITVESSVGKGSTFSCYFPVLRAHGITQQQTATTEELRGGTETILIVEDEPLLCTLLHDALRTHGYTVLTAYNGDEALALYQANQPIDLVVSDYGLPKFTGEELYLRLKKLNPTVKFVLASGFIEPSLKTQIQKLGIRTFLQKPYDAEQILRVVRRALDEQTHSAS